MKTEIILSTLNARYIHASLGLRYLYANMGDLRDISSIMEFVTETRTADIAESLLQHSPKIIGIGVYIWNANEVLNLVSLIKQVSPGTIIVLGGPEISYEIEEQALCHYADYIILGQADLEFANLCQQILGNRPPLTKIIQPTSFKPNDLVFPYDDYSDEDIRNRIIYVEASRGCPFKCEFCLSSLDKTVYPFDLDNFLVEMEKLYQRGTRSFKFIDRTFNLKAKTSAYILNYFLKKIQDDNAELFLHFELIPDHLPESLKSIITLFPEGSLQFEIGIQTFNPEIQLNISRKQDNEKAKANVQWLRNETNVHLHTDLILGLPGENLDSIEKGFNLLASMNPHEIQVGILKRLKGTPIIRHTNEFDIRYSLQPPFEVLSNRDIDFSTMQKLKRFARYWELVANSGRFQNTLPLIMGENPFKNFYQLSTWLYEYCGKTYRIALPRLFGLLYTGMIDLFGMPENDVKEALEKDFNQSKLKGYASSLLQIVSPHETDSVTKKLNTRSRQNRHGNSN